MKYKRDGRVYKLREWFPFIKSSCNGCAFMEKRIKYGWRICPANYRTLICVFPDGKNRVWRETIPSKIRGWLRGIR